MKDFNVLSYVGRSLWAIHPDKWAEMLPALVRHAKGDKLSAAELQAFMQDRETEPAKSSKRGAIAIIPVRGVIAHRMDLITESSGGASCEGISAMIDAVATDAGISTIVYDFDTPGGTVTGLTELAAKMFALRGVKKQIAMVNGMCCSAGAWLAAQCDEIVCIPSGTFGSIGVFSVHQDISGLLEKEGVAITINSAGKYKTEGNPFEKLGDEAKAILQARVDEAYAQFAKDYGRGRGVTAAEVRNGHGEGRALSAKDAKTAGMIDRIATMDETLARLTGRRSSSAMRAESPDGELTAAQLEELALYGDSDAPEPQGILNAPADLVSDEMRQRLERF